MLHCISPICDLIKLVKVLCPFKFDISSFGWDQKASLFLYCVEQQLIHTKLVGVMDLGLCYQDRMKFTRTPWKLNSSLYYLELCVKKRVCKNELPLYEVICWSNSDLWVSFDKLQSWSTPILHIPLSVFNFSSSVVLNSFIVLHTCTQSIQSSKMDSACKSVLFIYENVTYLPLVQFVDMNF